MKLNPVMPGSVFWYVLATHRSRCFSTMSIGTVYQCMSVRAPVAKTSKQDASWDLHLPNGDPILRCKIHAVTFGYAVEIEEFVILLQGQVDTDVSLRMFIIHV